MRTIRSAGAALLAAAAISLPASRAQATCPPLQTPSCPPCAAPFCDRDVGGWTCGGVQSAGTSCTDNDACTLGDTCDGAGSCSVHTSTVTCNPPPVCHQAVSCNASTGTCATTYPNSPDGTPCGSPPPNATQTCTSGVCAGTWTCNSNSGYKACGNACIPNGQCCTNGDCPIANGFGTCSQGSCTAGATSCVNQNQPGGYHICGPACIPMSQCCAASDCHQTLSGGTATCTSGVCGIACNAGYTPCSSTLCVNLSSGGCCSNTNCGISQGHQTFCVQNQCSMTCTANSDCALPGNVGEQTCSSGTCGNPVICADGYKVCSASGTCVAQSGCCSNSDCASGLTCTAGACSLSCTAGTQPCGNTCVATSASVCCPRDN